MAYLNVPVWPITQKKSPCKEEGDLRLGFLVLKGVHVRYDVGDIVTLLHSGDDDIISHEPATVYDIKHITLADLSKYHRLLEYFVIPETSRFMDIRKWLQGEYPGIIDGEIVTMVFYALTVEDETE